MIFSAATFLYLLPLAGLPILFHLVLRRKRRRMVFSTLMFFQRMHPRMNARRRLRQWLLLALRMLLIGLLLAAVARPVLRGAGRWGGKQRVVVLVDNSASMGGLDQDGEVKLRSAVQAEPIETETS